MSTPAVSIGRLSVTTHLEEGRAEDATRVARLLGQVAAERLDRALRDAPLPPGIWCVRHLDVTVGLDLDRPDPALEAAWAGTLVGALRQALQQGSPEVVRYDHERDALDDLVRGAVTGRLRRAWAWRRLGLLQPADPPLDRAAGEALVAVLGRRPRQALGAVLLAADRVGLAALQRVLGPSGWTAVAGVVREALGAGPARPVRGRGEDPGAGGRSARAAALVEGSRLADLVGGSRVHLDPQTLDALALLVVADRDPSALRRPAGEALVAAVARALAARSPGAKAHPARGPDPNPQAAGRPADADDPGDVDTPAQPSPEVGYAPPPGDPNVAGRAAGRPLALGQPAAAGRTDGELGDPAARRAGGGPGDRATGRVGDGPGAPAAGRAAAEDPGDPAAGRAGGVPGDPAAAGGPQGAPSSPASQPWPREHPTSRREAPRRGSVADGEPTGLRVSTAPDGGAASPSATLAEGGPRGRPTEWAGLLFLLATADRAGIPAAVLDDQVFAARPLPWALQGIALKLLPATDHDPAVAAFAATDPEAPPPWRLGPPAGDEELARLALLAHRWATVTAAALGEPERDPLDVVASIARRGGVIDHAPGWLEVHLDIDQVDVAVRKAGLDLDPGWVPWLGTVVRFVYA